jgi:hypothetical protein
MALIDLAIGLGLSALAGSVAIVPDAGAKPAATGKTDKACTPEDLVGRYVIVSGEKDGLKEPEERIKGTVVTFAKDSVIVAEKDKNFSLSFLGQERLRRIGILVLSVADEERSGELQMVFQVSPLQARVLDLLLQSRGKVSISLREQSSEQPR